MSTAENLIRPKSPKSGRRVWLEHIPLLWNHMSFLAKVSVRNVFRYKQRFFMMVIGIGGCTALLVTGYGIKDTIADIADMQYEEVQLYDMSATLKEGYPAADAADFSELTKVLSESSEDWMPFCEIAMDLRVRIFLGLVRKRLLSVQSLRENAGSALGIPLRCGQRMAKS